MRFDNHGVCSNQSTLPPDWQPVPIKSIATINELSIQKTYDSEIIEYIDITSVDSGFINEVQEMRLSEAPSRARRIVRTNDILISSVRPNLKHYAFIKEAKHNTVASTGFVVISPKDIEARYLYYYLTTVHFTEYLTRIAESHTSAYPAFNPDIIENANLLVPPVYEQRAIAYILGTLDDKIELNRRMNETLEAIARAIFKSWFIDFDPVRAKAEGRDPGLPQPIADLFPDSFYASELGEIPEGWKIGDFGMIAENIRRTIKPEDIDCNYPYIALEHMPKRCIALSEWSVADGLESSKFTFRCGEILFGKLRPYFHKVGVAPINGVCSTDILVVAPKQPSWFGFVLGHITSDVFIEFVNAGSTGTKMPRTSWNEMARFKIVLPTETISKIYTNFVLLLVNKIIMAIHESHTIAAMRDALLPKLISGAIRMKGSDSYL